MTDELNRSRELAAAAAQAWAAGKRIGRYAIVGELGRGGMGVVYRAYDTTVKRAVALKMILDPAQAGPQQLERFRIEATATGRLQHPGIVSVLDAGAHEGKPYLVMELIEGRSFEALLEAGPLAPKRVAEIVMAVALALEHAHGKGIVHRDVKPENVIVDREGKPHLMDFGLAQDAGAQRMTQTGQVLGTPAYMSPEQASGERGGVGPASDVYALGAVLYRALVGRPPFKADSNVALMKKILFDEPEAPRSVNPRVHADLETIALRCLAKEPERRYPGAAAVAQELERFLAGEAIEARPVGQLERLRLWVRRNRILAAALVALTIALGATAVLAPWLTISYRRERARVGAEEAKKHADAFRLPLETEPDAERLATLVEKELALTGDALASELEAMRMGKEARLAFLLERRLVANDHIAYDTKWEDPKRCLTLLRKVAEDAERLLALDPARRPRWLFTKAWALRGWQDPGVDGLLERCVAEDKTGAHGTLCAATLACERGDMVGGTKAARRAIQLAPGSSNVAISASMIFEWAAEFSSARDALAGALLTQESPIYKRLEARALALEKGLQGRNLRNQARYLEAIAILHEGANANPYDYVVAEELSRAESDIGDFAGAKKACSDFLALVPDAKLHSLRGDAERHLGELDAALEDLSGPSRALPNDPDIHHALAQVLVALKRYPESLLEEEKAIALSPRNADYVVHRADLLRLLGRRDEAASEARRVLSELAAPSTPAGWSATRILEALEKRTAPR